VPPAERKIINKQIAEVLPIAEELKQELLRKFERDYQEFRLQIQRARKEDEERQRLKEKKEEVNKRASHSAPSYSQISTNALGSQKTPASAHHSTISPITGLPKTSTEGSYNIQNYSLPYSPTAAYSSPSAPYMYYPDVPSPYSTASVVAGAGQPNDLNSQPQVSRSGTFW